jgi:hypothetical protein
MNRAMKLGLLAVAMLTATAGTVHADQILNYTFSFQNDGTGNVPGTVSGTLALDVAPSGSAYATSLLVESVPPGLSAFAPLPINLLSWTNSGNAFTVTNGQVTYDQFTAYIIYPYTPYPPYDQVSFDLTGGPGNPDQANALAGWIGRPTNSNGPDQVADLGGLPAAHIARTPEPTSIALLASGFLAAGGFGLWRRRRTTSAS